jgi:lipopolysaccharide/colanic/teichoic acid biosynthesis glycosyltransferase
MVVDAEPDNVAKWAAPSDPRITRVGRFLRRSRVDEIPQLMNVLLGDMSIVGPRPERPAIVEDLKEIIPLYSSRHLVLPGLTGWAQINYPYGASTEDALQKTKFDLYYVKNGSFILDLIILIQTVRVVILGEGWR